MPRSASILLRIFTAVLLLVSALAFIMWCVNSFDWDHPLWTHRTADGGQWMVQDGGENITITRTGPKRHVAHEPPRIRWPGAIGNGWEAYQPRETSWGDSEGGLRWESFDGFDPRSSTMRKGSYLSVPWLYLTAITGAWPLYWWGYRRQRRRVRRAAVWLGRRWAIAVAAILLLLWPLSYIGFARTTGICNVSLGMGGGWLVIRHIIPYPRPADWKSIEHDVVVAQNVVVAQYAYGYVSSPVGPKYPPIEIWCVRIWALLAALSPFVWLNLRAWKRERRRTHWQREGRCTDCGYDLRASPECCPECGSAKPSAHHVS